MLVNEAFDAPCELGPEVNGVDFAAVDVWRESAIGGGGG